MDLLLNNWKPALTTKNICTGLLELLKYPNPTDALDSTIASEMIQDYNFKEPLIEKMGAQESQPSGDIAETLQ